MARGREGAFGGKTLLKPYVWVAFCLVFLLGLADLRRPLSMRNLDLLALLGFTVSLAFFDRGEIFRSVPLVYPVLAYLLARGLWVGFGRRSGSASRRSGRRGCSPRPRSSCSGSGSGSNLEAPRGVIDVGLAGVVGADRILDGEAPYGNMPQRGDARSRAARRTPRGTCAIASRRTGAARPRSSAGTPTARFPISPTCPRSPCFGWSGKWDSLPAAHTTSIAFDLLAVLALLLIGLRFGGRRLAVLLAFALDRLPVHGLHARCEHE